MTNWKYTAYRSMWAALDLLFPPLCGGCGKVGSRWCDECQGKVKSISGNVCNKCGLPQEKPGTCSVCLADMPHFLSLRAWAVFEGPVQSVLHKLKYRRDLSLGDAIAASMIPFVRSLNWDIDLVTSIPLGRQRIKERGYNQVEMIARPLALGLEMNYSVNVLERRKETRTQVGLSRVERRVNVEDVFRADAKVRGKSILLMDDVSTTGATLSSAARTFYNAGARNVYALTVARALPHHDLRRV